MPKKMEYCFNKKSHMVLQLSTYTVIITGNINKNFRRCVKVKKVT